MWTWRFGPATGAVHELRLRRPGCGNTMGLIDISYLLKTQNVSQLFGGHMGYMSVKDEHFPGLEF